MLTMIERFIFAALLFSPAWAEQPQAPAPIAAPLRDLPWGQINFLHTTDTHGWHAGHLQEPSYSADWGDYISFAERMREKADKDGVDLLLVDTGDRVEGNGLYDASHPKGLYTSDILKEQNIDLICSGNHELYKQNTSELEYTRTVRDFRGNYLASNIDIYDPETGDLVPLAPRFKKFQTKNQGIRIMAFGFLFDFTGNYNNTVVQPVADTLKEKWFQDAIRDREIDLFVVIGHSAVQSEEFQRIFKEIRSVQWDTPIQFFGGHFHIRDYAKYDQNSYGLASGRYMETIGFMSLSGVSTGKDDKLISPRAASTFSRRYIDNNLYSYYHHTGLNSTAFPTSHGQNVSAFIKSARHALQLDNTLGCAPVDLYTNRVKYPHDHSIYSWVEQKVLPKVVCDPFRSEIPRLAILNTGSLRFDIFRGAFTTDSTYIVSPFTSGFHYIKNVPYKNAQRLLAVLNNDAPILQGLDSSLKTSVLAPLEQLAYSNDVIAPPVEESILSAPAGDQTPLGDSNPTVPLTPGYITHDDGGSDGDDTVHAPMSFYRVPNCIQAEIGFSSNNEPETVDLVFMDFIQPWVLLGLKFVGLEYELEDVEVYMNGTTFTDLLGEWVVAGAGAGAINRTVEECAAYAYAAITGNVPVFQRSPKE
ncbi:MAG: hypothetical protein M1834_007574 [Cirrosporium novae-zelandiae]|nr:MAG: hypothetical protein M1834_007574 [Cirrosporium novae-zelandiae]